MAEDASAELARQISATLERAKASIGDSHRAIVRTMLDSLDRMLHEAAAVGTLGDVQPWLAYQLEQLQFFITAWRPGASPASAALEALEGRAIDRPQ